MSERRSDSEWLRKMADAEDQASIATGGMLTGGIGLLPDRENRFLALAATELVWQAPVSAKKCTVLAGSLDAVGASLARYGVLWNSKRRGLSAGVGGWLALGSGVTLDVRWLREDGTLAEARSGNNSTPPFLPSPDGEPPLPGDRLEFRHRREGPKGWDVQFSVEL
jgi:hypothetical protein